MYGISVFLGEEITNDTIIYIKKMKALGFDGIFTSLHIPEDDTSRYRQRLTDLGAIAKAEKMKIMVDISGEALKRAGFSFDELEPLIELGVTGLRMDYGITIEQMAHASHKIDIGLNASTITLEEVAELKAHQADFSRLEAWHNYYPRPETGIGTTFFNEKNRWLKELGLQVFTFVPGDGQTRGPIFAGLPTLEKHRGQNPFAAAVGLMADPYVDAVYIGDPTISERTMAQFGYYYQTNQFLLEVVPNKSRYLKRILGTHTNRLDAARDVLRSELSRTSEMFRKDEIATIESEQTEARPVGTVTIDNEKYGRYMGEIQVTLVDLPKDEKVNTITRIIEKDQTILPLIKAGNQFTLVTEGTIENEFRKLNN
ncbi:DUF871 domain-containing protein [Enterococcus faecalis]